MVLTVSPICVIFSFWTFFGFGGSQVIRLGGNLVLARLLFPEAFGIMALAGVIFGSFWWSLISRSFKVEWFASFKDFVNHFIGAILMGFGGVLAMGCTIGQGLSGLSTLAIGSFVALAAIMAGAALGLRWQTWRLERSL